MAQAKTEAHKKLYRLIADSSYESYTSVWKDLFPGRKISEEYDVVKMANMVDEEDIEDFIKQHNL